MLETASSLSGTRYPFRYRREIDGRLQTESGSGGACSGTRARAEPQHDTPLATRVSHRFLTGDTKSRAPGLCNVQLQPGDYTLLGAARTRHDRLHEYETKIQA